MLSWYLLDRRGRFALQTFIKTCDKKKMHLWKAIKSCGEGVNTDTSIRAGWCMTTISTAQYTVGSSVTDWRVNLTFSHFISEKQIFQHTVSYIRSAVFFVLLSGFQMYWSNTASQFLCLRVIRYWFTRKTAGGATRSYYTSRYCSESHIYAERILTLVFLQHQ